jgi:hypothetical protein
MALEVADCQLNLKNYASLSALFFLSRCHAFRKRLGFLVFGFLVFGFFISFLQTSLALMVQPLEVAFSRLHLALGAPGAGVPPGSPKNAAAWTRLYKVLYTDAATGVFPSFLRRWGRKRTRWCFFSSTGQAG